MKLQTALLLSSKKQAVATITHNCGVFSRLTPRYKLFVTKDAETPVFTLGIHHVAYPDKAPGKGWGNPVVAAHPHSEQSFESLEELAQFLQAHDLATETGWDSVEDPEPA